jgi:hypothetical protein
MYRFKTFSKNVIPAKAGIHNMLKLMDSRWNLSRYKRGGKDKLGIIRAYLNTSHIIIAVLIYTPVFSFFLSSWLLRPGLCQEPQESMTINATEVKDEGHEVRESVSLSEVKEAREVTEGRIYGLIILWALIIFTVLIVYYQLRDDEALYRQGFYNREI